ncbi:MAG: hypothetical protein ACTSYD_07180 [Candidatus Heimdallarchaeaceae archaeon]
MLMAKGVLYLTSGERIPFKDIKVKESYVVIITEPFLGGSKIKGFPMSKVDYWVENIKTSDKELCFEKLGRYMN